MRYIRSIRVTDPGTHNEHIAYVRYSTGISGELRTQSRADAARDIESLVASYRSHNDRTGTGAEVQARTSSRGVRYIATVANGRENDNLLSLPRF